MNTPNFTFRVSYDHIWAVSSDKAFRAIDSALFPGSRVNRHAERLGGRVKIVDEIDHVDSVYLRSSQNSQPNSDASDVNSRKERGRVFRIARSDPPPAF